MYENGEQAYKAVYSIERKSGKKGKAHGMHYGQSACMSNGHSTCNMFHSRHETEKGVNGEATGGRRPPGQQVGLLQSCLLQMQHETGSIGEVLVSLVGSLVP